MIKSLISFFYLIKNMKWLRTVGNIWQHTENFLLNTHTTIQNESLFCKKDFTIYILTLNSTCERFLCYHMCACLQSGWIATTYVSTTHIHFIMSIDLNIYIFIYKKEYYGNRRGQHCDIWMLNNKTHSHIFLWVYVAFADHNFSIHSFNKSSHFFFY